MAGWRNTGLDLLEERGGGFRRGCSGNQICQQDTIGVDLGWCLGGTQATYDTCCVAEDVSSVFHY